METEEFNTCLTSKSFGLIAIWARNALFKPFSENSAVADQFSYLLNIPKINLSTVAKDYPVDNDHTIEPIGEELALDESLEFIFNLIRFDMLVNYLVQATHELNPYASVQMHIQAHNLIKEFVIPMLQDNSHEHGEINEMGVLKLLGTIKTKLMGEIELNRIILLLESDQTTNLLKILAILENAILDENSDFLDAAENI